MQDVKDALENPIGFGDKIVMSDGDERQKYFGKRASVVISITDKKLIQATPDHQCNGSMERHPGVRGKGLQ